MKRLAAIGSVILTGVVIAACGGGGDGSSSAQPTSSTSPATAPDSVGLWKGTAITSTSGQPQEAVGTVSQDGQFHMTLANGMTFVGTMRAAGSSFSMAMTAYMPAGQTFPNGAQSASVTFSGSMSSTGMMSGSYSGGGQSGSFSMNLDQMGLRSASLTALAGTYTRSNGAGYTITMTIGANGQVTGSDTQGCVFSGTVSVPSASRNLYSMNMTVTSCGAMNGSYTGMGTLVDASSMTSWMSSMRSSMMSGAMSGGRNVVPTGTSNLFMYALSNGQRAIADSLYR